METLVKIKNLSIGFFSQEKPSNVVNSISFNIPKGKTVALESANRNYETKIFGPDRVKVQGVLVSLYRNFH